MKKRLLLTLAALTAAIVVGLGVFAARWYRDMNREDPYTSPAPDAPAAPKWDRQQTANDSGAPPIGEIPGITYYQCPAEFARPLEDLSHEIPEVPAGLLGPSPPIEKD